MNPSLLDTLIQADEAGVKLEVVGGVPLWEAMPKPRHQRAIDRIRASIAPDPTTDQEKGYKCVHLSNVYIRFPDGSLKRPDVSIFCQDPSEEDEAIAQIPEAVIEIVSPGYEAKDFEFGPPFYLAQGVNDVVVFDPRTLLVLHIRRNTTTRHTSPVTLHLECGCHCTV
jgi:Uma2 family endonuclease